MKTKQPVSNEVAQKIALRAYHIWENEGRPHGRDHAHWQMAEAEIMSEPHAKKAAAPVTPTAKKAAPKKAAGSGSAKKSAIEPVKAAIKAAAKTVMPKAGKAKKSTPPDA